MKAITFSIILNVMLMGTLCFFVYNKRNSIIGCAHKIYETIFNKNYEDSILIFNQNKYETNVNYINKNNYQENIKIAILGNSISLHGIVDGLWDHESGMAASDLEHDYVHVLLNKISEEKQYGIEYIVINIADFERGFENFDQNRLERIKEFDPEIVVFQIGENIQKEMLKAKREIFKMKYMEIIEYCNGKETIICLPFWADKETINVITEVALNEKVYLVDLSHLGNGIDPQNLSASENKYKHAGVAAHPGDYGMENIAKMIFITMDKIID